MAGALQVLSLDEHKEWLAKHPNEGGYTVNFSNNAAAKIEPNHLLWKKLEEIAKTYTVEVFPNTLRSAYVPFDLSKGKWTFDAIRITAQEKTAQ